LVLVRHISLVRPYLVLEFPELRGVGHCHFHEFNTVPALSTYIPMHCKTCEHPLHSVNRPSRCLNRYPAERGDVPVILRCDDITVQVSLLVPRTQIQMRLLHEIESVREEVIDYHTQASWSITTILRSQSSPLCTTIRGAASPQWNVDRVLSSKTDNAESNQEPNDDTIV